MFKKKLTYIYEYIFYVFCFILPFSDLAKALPNILVIALASLYGFVISKEDFKLLNTKSFKALLFFLIAVVFSTLIFSRQEDFKITLRIFIILAVILLSIPIKNLRFVLLSYVGGALTFLLVSGFNIISYLIEYKSISFNTGDHINKLLLGERPYIGFLFLIAFCSCLFLYSSSDSTKQRALYASLSSLFVIFIVAVSARMAMISLVLILLFTLCFFRNKKKVLLQSMLIFLASGFVLFLFSNNIQKRFFLSSDNTPIISRLSSEPRYHIWACGFALSQNSQTLLFGRGFIETENQLTECYKTRDLFLSEDQQTWFVNNKFNTHNQLLDIYLSQGLVSLLAFLSFVLLLAIESKRNYILVSFILVSFMFLLTENVMIRQLGGMLLGLVIAIVYKVNSLSNIKN